ncbi:hypothetical protein D3C80_1028710 [compost metagenome]
MKRYLPLLIIPFIAACQKENIEARTAEPVVYLVKLQCKNTRGFFRILTDNRDNNPITSKDLSNCNNYAKVPDSVSCDFKILKGDRIIGVADISDCDRNDQVYPKKAYLTITAGDKVIRDSIVLTADKKYGTKVITME